MKYYILYCSESIENYDICIENKIAGFVNSTPSVGDRVYFAVKMPKDANHNLSGRPVCGARAILGETTEKRPWKDSEKYKKVFNVSDIKYCELFDMGVLNETNSDENKGSYGIYLRAPCPLPEQYIKKLDEVFSQRITSAPFLFKENNVNGKLYEVNHGSLFPLKSLENDADDCYTSDNESEDYDCYDVDEQGPLVDLNETKLKDIIRNLHSYLKNNGFVYEYEALANFYLSLKTRPFVILAGISGTGKSKLVRLFANFFGATNHNGRFSMISVRPDWNDNSELIGFTNIKEQFVCGTLTRIIKRAIKDKKKPYFVCLDEMNLARAEYYLSDYLSKLESRKFDGDEIKTDLIFDRSTRKYKKNLETLYIPENVFIVGTVNMDDTTYSFSKKVLDRVNTIEFSDVDLNLNFSNRNSMQVSCLNASNSFLKASFIATTHIDPNLQEYALKMNEKIIKINNILKKQNKHFGYRVRDDVVFYMLENKKMELIKEEEALDYQIIQKILPSIIGSDTGVKDALIDLFNYLSDSKIEKNGNYLKDISQRINANEIKFKKSLNKIAFMLKGFEDGFTSFWT